MKKTTKWALIGAGVLGLLWFMRKKKQTGDQQQKAAQSDQNVEMIRAAREIAQQTMRGAGLEGATPAAQSSCAPAPPRQRVTVSRPVQQTRRIGTAPTNGAGLNGTGSGNGTCAGSVCRPRPAGLAGRASMKRGKSKFSGG